MKITPRDCDRLVGTGVFWDSCSALGNKDVVCHHILRHYGNIIVYSLLKNAHYCSHVCLRVPFDIPGSQLLAWRAMGSSVGVPNVLKMRLSNSVSVLPGNSGSFCSHSAKMQPTDHRSTEGSYASSPGPAADRDLHAKATPPHPHSRDWSAGVGKGPSSWT